MCHFSQYSCNLYSYSNDICTSLPKVSLETEDVEQIFQLTGELSLCSPICPAPGQEMNGPEWCNVSVTDATYQNKWRAETLHLGACGQKKNEGNIDVRTLPVPPQLPIKGGISVGVIGCMDLKKRKTFYSQ